MRPHHTRTVIVTVAVLLLCASVFLGQEYGPTGRVTDTFGATVIVTDGSEDAPAPAVERSSGSSSTPRLGPWSFTTRETPPAHDGAPAAAPRFDLSAVEVEVPPLVAGSVVSMPITITNSAQEDITITLTSTDAAVQVPPPVTVPPNETVTLMVDITIDWVGTRELSVSVSDGVDVRLATVSINVPEIQSPIAVPIITESPAPLTWPPWATDAILVVGLLTVSLGTALFYFKPRV